MKLAPSTYHLSETPEVVIDSLVDYITDALSEDQSVLWLVSGGSNIQTAVQIQDQLQRRGSLDLLTIGLIDERYGDRGHENSNWQQLIEAGWNTQYGTMLEVLLSPALGLTQTAEQYQTALHNAKENGSILVGLFGLGSDGHTAGVLPDSAAVDSDENVFAYVARDYQRITITAKFMSKIDFGVVAAFGEAKKEALIDVYVEGLANRIPARQLATVKSLVVYTDNKGVI